MASWIRDNSAPLTSLKKTAGLQPIEQKRITSILDRRDKAPRCCLCSRTMSRGGIVIEERPTAEDGSMQKWFYCPACWVELRNLREASGNQQRLLNDLYSSQDSDD